MTFYLPLACIWIVIGVLLLYWHHANPDAPGRDILGTGVSAGWVAIMLACYNLARWFSSRSAAVQRRRTAETYRDGYRAARKRPVPEQDTPFDFSDDPKTAEEKRGPKDPP